MTKTDDQIIQAAKDILLARLRIPGAALTSPDLVRDYLTLEVAEAESEVFGVLFLDSQHCVIVNEVLFLGTIDGASVYPREVVKAALRCNAAAAVFYHNHPSGTAEPSQADKRITLRLVDALKLIDVRTLDHFIIGGAAIGGEINFCSFAERGLL